MAARDGACDRLSRGALVDGGFLAALDHAQDIRDPAALVEAAQRAQQPALFVAGGAVGELKGCPRVILGMDELGGAGGLPFCTRADRFFDLLELHDRLVVIEIFHHFKSNI